MNQGNSSGETEPIVTQRSDNLPIRGRPRSKETRKAILSAVRSLLLSQGYASLTMEGVAARAGVSKTTIYRWWPSRGELVLEAAHEEIAIGVVPCTGNPEADLENAIDQLIETFSRPLASIVIFAAITRGGEDPRMAQIFREKYVYPWRISAADALTRTIGPEGSQADLQFFLDVIVGTVFQRTLVLKEPNTEGLKTRLMALVAAARPKS